MGSQEHDYGIASEIPATARVTQAINAFVFAVFSQQPMVLFWNLFTVLVLAILISAKTRHLYGGAVVGAVLIVALLVISFLNGVLVLGFNRARWFRLLFGRPAFGKLSPALPRAVFRVTLGASKEMRVEFDTKQDQQRMQDFAAFDLQVLEAYLREHFLADRSKDASASVDQLAEEWRDVWENRILPTEANGVTLRDAYRNQSYAFQILPANFLRTVSLTDPLTAFYVLVVMWTLILRLTSGDELLPVFQLALFLSFGLSIVLYLNFSLNFARFYLVNLPLPGNLEATFASEAGRFAGFAPHLKKITMSRRSISLLRNFYGRILAISMARASLLLLCFVLLSFAVGWLTAPAARAELRSWYGNLAAAAIVVPLGMLVGHYVTFWILQHLRQFAGLLLVGAIIAFAPALINYLFTGTLPTTRAVFLSSTISGIIASAGTSLAEQWAKTLSARSAPEASRS